MPELSNNQDAEVKISPQGQMKCELITTTVSGTGAQTGQFTVPTGKIWIIKNVNQAFASGWSGTVSSCQFIMILNSQQITLLTDSSLLVGVETQLGQHDYILTAGQYVRSVVNLSAWTSGNIYHKLVIIELDA